MQIRTKDLAIYPPSMIVGATVILLAIVLVLALNNIKREERYMSQILSEKGGALIKSFEAGARTGMMGMMWGGNQVQKLLEETAGQPGILYLAVTDQTGRILAHSDRTLIGRAFLDSSFIQTLNPGSEEQWRATTSVGGQRAFEVYRYFRPWTSRGAVPRTGMCMEDRAQGSWISQEDDWCMPSDRPGREQIIFVGLDVSPFEAARSEDIRNTVIISLVLVVLGLGGFLSIFLVQRYRTTKRLLQDTSAFADEVVTSLPVGLIATDRINRIAFFNEAAERITGLSFLEVRGKEPEKVLPASLCSLRGVLDQGQTVLEQEMECDFSGKKSVPISVSVNRIVNDEGDFVGNIFILRDLGEVRRLQAEIRRKEKLAAMGGLAAGIAHELRNPLSSIKGLAVYFGSKFHEGSEDREAAAVMVREVERLNRVISELLEFARPSELIPKPTDVNELLEHSVRLIQKDAMKRKIEIQLSKSPGPAVAHLDPDRFSQALLNLYLNALQAMDKGGVLSVTAASINHGNIAIEVRDTGIGIDPDDLPKIFDPYFTTKSTGTGLGLAIVHKIIEAHQASIKVRSTPGKGTIFTIILPVGSSPGIEGGHYGHGEEHHDTRC